MQVRIVVLNMPQRKIIHIDMDAFYASIEQRDDVSLRGKPVAVGYSGDRGVVAAASYEARKFGIRSAMPSVTAKKKCTSLIFVPARFDVYRAVSAQIMDVFREYTDIVEPLSLDEAFLDVTDNKKNNPSATLIAREIKLKIKERTGLTASAGVSVNKFLAKVASDMGKPDGLFVIKPEDVDVFVRNLRIEDFYGVGRVTAVKMHELGIATGSDLRNISEEGLTRHFGKAGHSYYNFARGIDNREVCPDRIRKSVGEENTFLKDLVDREEIMSELDVVAGVVWDRVSTKNFRGRTVTLKIKYSDFDIMTRSLTFPDFIRDYHVFYDTSVNLMNSVNLNGRKIRLIGLTVSNVELPKKLDARQLRFDF